MPALIVENGPDKGRRVDLKPGDKATVGRDGGCEVPLSDHLCSRRHFEIVDRNGAWALRDLDSSNGTFVNDERVQGERPLKDGDSVQAGETMFVFQADAAAVAGPSGVAGKVVGGYRILDRLGRGAMGTVFKANQTSLNRVVALKILSPKISADPAFVKRFHAEAQAAGRLNHPNVVQVYDVGHDPAQNLHYYSMEYIENGTVEDLHRKSDGKLDTDMVVDIVTDAARGLVYAEKKGVVHRDIKPANLMINADGVVKIADLGLAHDVGSARGADEPVFGTPHFISPEQAQGRPVDARSDLYSLGATAYFLVAGETPFDGDNVLEIVRKQIEEEPEPLRSKRADCPPKLAEVVAKLMRKDPADRYASAQELVEALEAISAAGSGRGKAPLLLAGGVVVVAVAAFGAFKAFGNDREPAPPIEQNGGGTPKDADAAREAEARRAEAERLQREAAADVALSEARIADADARSGEGDPATWSKVRDAYRGVVERFPGTPAASKAKTAAQEIEDRLAADEARVAAESRAAESRAAEVAAAVEAVAAAAKPHLDAKAFGAAALAAHAERKKAPEHAQTLVKAEAERVAKIALDACAAAVAEALTQAKAAEAKDPEAAATALLAAADGFAGFDPSGPAKAIHDAVEPLRTEAAAIRERFEKARREDRAADVAAVFKARKAATEILHRACDLKAARAALEAAAATLKTDAGRAALQPDVDALDAALRVRDAWVAALKATPPDGRVRLPSPSDKKRTYEYSLVSVDKDGVSAKRGPVDVRFDLSSYSLADAYDLFFKEPLDKIEGPRDDAIELLLLAGRADRALEILAHLPDGPRKDALQKRARREDEGRKLLEQVRDLETRAHADESLAGKLLLAVNRLLEEYADTRACLLSRRDPPEAP
jgi:pSer/pThr/pTyr-binding forkhead associated (FHA) protein